MQVMIPSPRHYENMYGSSNLVRAYLDHIEKKIQEAYPPEVYDVFDVLYISLLIARPDELARGLFLGSNTFDWRGKFEGIGVNGDFERYHSGNDLDKIHVLSEMLQMVFLQLSQKKKAKFHCSLANESVIYSTQFFEKKFREQACT